MKVRFQDQSIRFRLSATEVYQLAEGHPVCVNLQPDPSQSWNIVLQTWHLQAFQADITTARLEVKVPESVVRDWANRDVEGIYGQQENGSEHPIGIAVEKDYPCLHKDTGGQKRGTFPRPEEEEGTC